MNVLPPVGIDNWAALWYLSPRKGVRRMSWQLLYWNQEKVREALQRGEYDDASLTGWGRLDDLVALAEGLGVLKELHAIQPDLTREGDIPRWFIHHALFLRTVVGDESLSAMQEGLFRDTGVLRLLGCTAREIRKGFAAHRNQGEHTPCHVDSLRYSLKHTPAGQFYQAFTHCRVRWIQDGFIKRRGTYILDATKIEVDGEYEGAGEMTVLEEILRHPGQALSAPGGHEGLQAGDPLLSGAQAQAAGGDGLSRAADPAA
jgi:hypothetical protein